MLLEKDASHSLQLGRREELFSARAGTPPDRPGPFPQCGASSQALYRHQSAPRASLRRWPPGTPSVPASSREPRTPRPARTGMMGSALLYMNIAGHQSKPRPARALVAEVPSNLSLGPRAVLVGQSQSLQLPSGAREERNLSRVTLLTTRRRSTCSPSRPEPPHAADVSEPLGDGRPREHGRRRLLERHRGSCTTFRLGRGLTFQHSLERRGDHAGL